jgi:hypothetical protein
MPTIRFGEHTVPCEAGVTLRDALRDAGLSPHNGRARFINCTGLALLSQGYPKGGAGSISCGRPRGTYGWQQHGQRGRYRSDARRATRALVLGTEC